MRQGDDAAMGRSTCFKEDHYHARETNTSTTLEISTRSEQSTTNLTGCPHQAVALQHTLRHHPPTLQRIVKVLPVLQPNRRPRFDIWIKNEVAAGLQKSLNLDFKGRQQLADYIFESKLPWHQCLILTIVIKIDRSSLPTRYWDQTATIYCRKRSRLHNRGAVAFHRDRVLLPPSPPEVTPPTLLDKFMSWNINGIKSKLPVLKQLLQDNNVSVAGIQEHIRTVCQYAPGVKNYNIFERPCEKGFWGHCLYVQNTLAAHKIQSTCKNIIYVKVFGLSGSKPWHIISVYMPSGNLRRKDRAEVWQVLKNLLLPLQKDKHSLITLMGDFNQDQDTITRILERGSLRCLSLKLTADPSSTSTRRYATTVRVDNISTDVSDHWPIFLNHQPLSKDTTCTRKLLSGHGLELALSDRWSCLSTDNLDTEEDLTKAAQDWVDILNATGEELGLLSIPKEQCTDHFDKVTKAAVTRSRRTRLALNKAVLRGDLPLISRLRKILPVHSATAKLAVKKYAKKIKLQRSTRVNSLLCDGEGADFHKLLQQLQGKSHTNQDNTPCFNQDNILVTNPKEILQARAAYSKQLAADPTGISKDPAQWTHVAPSVDEVSPLHITRVYTKNVDDNISEDGSTPSPQPEGVDADAFLMAIRQMQRNAAPGKSGVLTIHLKKFLEIECQLQVTQEWENAPQNQFGDATYPQQLDYSNVALDRWSLPSDLLTPPLIHLLNIIRSCIKLKTQPSVWNEEVLITLPKPGQDARLLKNTRGITLSCTEGKLLLTILARFVSNQLEAEGFFTNAQAGFRRGQEAVAHILALYEILKRRRNSNLCTYVLYIDFKKAFDRVPHEGLWAKLLQIGVHPDLVQLIRKGYDNSSIQCRLGNELSKPFAREIGTRQGCPLSPLLFIIFVNDILNKVTEGISVPGLPTLAKGLLFADDTLIFADTPEEIEAICEKLDKYCSEWHFALGHEKCGVVRYGCEPTLPEPPEGPTYELKEGTITTVPTYKYLGCMIPDTVTPKDPYPIETEHAKLLASKAEKSMHMLIPLLYDKDLHPLCKARIIQSYIMAVGSYGAELIAMSQKQTRTIQSVLDRAAKIGFGLKASNRTANTLLLSLELGITPLSIHCTLQRIRIWNKGPELGTILKDLIKYPYPGRYGTWASNTLTNIKKLVNQEKSLDDEDEEDDPLTTHHSLTWISSMRNNRTSLHPAAPSPIGNNERVTNEQWTHLRQMEGFHVTLLGKEVRREAKKSQSVARYDRYELGRSANFVSTSIIVPDLARGITYLCLLRMNAFPSLSKRIQALNAQRIPHTLAKGICPCCNTNAMDS
ncbi:hypothetical protein PSHT_09861 [Puccinia striiformis]|uniref:Reverse transcriptase domain-containing protein n=1 Tax=Puccinia striiformis TaxID=27350 RepID=A0A2S4VDX2_9BASI|nr:hypothetical protein PSHT_09861 [Puccinia striiformis]